MAAGLYLRVSCAHGLGFRVWNPGARGIRCSDLGFRASGFKVQGSRVSGLGFWG